MHATGRLQRFYWKNRKQYIAAVNGLIERTNGAINATIRSCRTVLATAKKDVQREFDKLTTSAQVEAKAMLSGVLKQLNALESRVSERETALKTKVEAKRAGAISSMEGEISRIKKSNQGFVNDVVDGVKAVAKALAKFALLVSRVSQRGVGSFISDRLSQAWDGIKNHLWKAIVVAFKDWLGAKVAPLTAVMKLPANALEVLASLGDTLLSFFLDVLPSVMKSVVKAFLAWFGEQAVRNLIPGFGSVGVIIDGLKAAWSFVRRVLSAAGRFFAFLMAVGAGKKVPQMFAGALVQGLIAGLDAVLTFFGVNKLIRRVGGAIAGPFKKKFAPLARGFARRKKQAKRRALRLADDGAMKSRRRRGTGRRRNDDATRSTGKGDAEPIARRRRNRGNERRIVATVAADLARRDGANGDYATVRTRLVRRAQRLERRHQSRADGGSRLVVEFEQTTRDESDGSIDMHVRLGRHSKRVSRLVVLDDLVVAFVLAGKSHRLFVKRDSHIRVTMASQRERIVAKYRGYERTIDHYLDLLRRPEFRELAMLLLPEIEMLNRTKSEQIVHFAAEIEDKNSKGRAQVLKDVEAAANALVKEIVKSTGLFGLDDMSPDVLERRMEAALEKSRLDALGEKRSEVQRLLEGHVPDILLLERDLRAQLDARPVQERVQLATPDTSAIVKFKYRGSLAKGRKSKEKGYALFNQDDFDIDAFVESDVIFVAAKNRGARTQRDELWADASRIPRLIEIQVAMRRAVEGMAGLRKSDVFKIKVRTTHRTKLKRLEPGERHIVVTPRE